MATIARVVGAAVACVAAVLNYLTDVFLTAPRRATLEYLGDTDLTTLSGRKTSLKAKSLWASSGAVIMAVRRPG